MGPRPNWPRDINEPLLSMPANLYAVLGVDANASPEQIQAAYSHRARELWPDPDAPVSAGFRELQDAYSVLGHPERRRVHEQRAAAASPRAEPLRPASTGAEPIERSGGGQPIQASLRESFAEFHPSFEELFDRLWSNFTLLTRPKAERVESLTVEIPLSPEEARCGGQARILIPARAQCPACQGHGAIGPYECWRCQGHGAITADYPLDVDYPAGVLNQCLVQVPLSRFGIENFYLTVRFRVTGAGP